jgi:protein-L-isoaspartate(D-aspartate) O-methyltransferase
MAELVGERGLVVGLEHIQELVDMGRSNMGKSAEGRALLGSGKVKFRLGDGRKGLVEPVREGEEAGGQGWDVIHVGASAKDVHSQLLEQLKSPGWWVFLLVLLVSVRCVCFGFLTLFATAYSSLSTMTLRASRRRCGESRRIKKATSKNIGCSGCVMCL